MRKGVVLAVTVPLLAVAIFLLRFLDDDVPIYLQGGERSETGVTQDAVAVIDLYLGMAAPPERAYFVAQFERMPTADERARIETQTNMRFLDAIPTDAYIISVPTIVGKSVFKELARRDPAATAIVSIRPTDKLAPDLRPVWQDPADIDSVPEYFRRPIGAPLASQPYIAVFVRFFLDVPIDQQRDGLQLATDDIWDTRVAAMEPTNSVWAVLIPRDEIGTLVDHPQVQSIEGAPAPAANDMDEVPDQIDAKTGIVETGTGVTVAQWELCQPDITHDDLSNVWIADAVQPQCDINLPDPENEHATIVAGIVTGDGIGNPSFKGVAPGARLVSFDTGEFGPISGNEYQLATATGATISTNSWGLPYETDLYSNLLNQPTKWYPEYSAFYDSLTSARFATGELVGTGDRILVVASTGNEGEKAPWFATRIANSAKNVVSVGNVAKGPGQSARIPAKESGRGPTADGRLSPVLVAPGIEAGGDGGITSTILNNQYGADSGTSFSTPIVSGAAALITEKFRHVCSGRQPVPAEIRALLINSTLDLTNAETEAIESGEESSSWRHPDVLSGDAYIGPDNIFGFGLLQIEDALAQVESSHFVTDEIEQGYVDYPVFVTPSTPLNAGYLRVTLAWDDPPFSTTSLPSAETGFLQNDLDLVVIDPAGTKHYPWVLDPTHPEKPAQASEISAEDYFAVAKRDRRNTMEQVSVSVPNAYINESWTIRVRANTMALGPQEFTLVSGAFVPQTMCGNVPSVSYPYLPPDSGWELWLLIIALFILTILIITLIILMWLCYQPIIGSSATLLRIFVMLLVLGFAFYLVLNALFVYLALLLLALSIYFFFNP